MAGPVRWPTLVQNLSEGGYLNNTPKIRQSTIYYAGLLGHWDKQIVDQEFDVPSIIFLNTFYRFRALKTFYFYFCDFIKKIRK